MNLFFSSHSDKSIVGEMLDIKRMRLVIYNMNNRRNADRVTPMSNFQFSIVAVNQAERLFM